MSPGRKRWAGLLVGGLVVVVFARSAVAQDTPPPPGPDPTLSAPPPPVDPFLNSFTLEPMTVVPEHLEINNQHFDGSVAGFRSYLETIKTTKPQLYAQLVPDAKRLESRAETSVAILAVGLGAGVAAVLVGLATRSVCTLPTVNDPNFARAADAWSACNQSNTDRVIDSGLLGFLAAAGGVAGYLATTPTRQDLLDVVNKHNRLSPDPMRLLIGYDAKQHLARAGAAISF